MRLLSTPDFALLVLGNLRFDLGAAPRAKIFSFKRFKTSGTVRHSIPVWGKP